MARSSIRLNVLNASDVSSAARDVREYLARKGYDVYDDRNSNEILPRTRIVDRRDPKMKFARELRNAVTKPARRLGPFRIQARRMPEIDCRLDSLLYLEATVVLGSDYRVFFPVEPRPF